VLEYANYRVIDRRMMMTTLSADYNSAMRFILRDETIENEFYLAKMDDTGSKRVFYFNYAINDLPVLLSSEIIGQIRLTYPIEIEVEYGIVTRYRKLVYRFVNFGTQTADLSYENVLRDVLAADEQPEDLPLDDISFGYQIDKGGEMVMYWFFELTNGRTLSRSAQMGAVW